MIDLSYDEQDAQSYITDIEHVEDKIVITYADGHQEEFPFTDHNLHYYRLSAISNAKEHMGESLKLYAHIALKTLITKYASVIISIFGLYFLYNFDIHLIIKIILTILIVLGELLYFTSKTVYELFLGMDISELLATEEYLKNDRLFEYLSNKLNEYTYVFPIEDISNYDLSIEEVKAVEEEVRKALKANQDLDNLSLSYKLKNPQTP